MFHSLFKTLFAVKMEEAGSAEAPAGGAGAGAPVTAPQEAAPAPAAEPAPVVEPEKTAPAEPAPDNGMQQFIDTYADDEPALALALGFLRDQGISPTDPAFTAAEVDGDFTLLEAILATKDAKGSDAMLAIFKNAVSEYHQKCEEHEAKTTEIVKTTLGEQSDEILEWARSTASDEEREQFNSLFEAGGLYARAAAALLKTAYADAGNTIPAGSPIKQGQMPAGNAGPLTARDYASAVEKLAREQRGDPRNSPEYAALTRRREAGRRSGI